jgi:hypothetical protein
MPPLFEIGSFLGILPGAHNIFSKQFRKEVMKDNIGMLGITDVCDSREITIR